MQQTPLVSVVIPCRNEVRFIDACLQSILLNQTLTEPYEVLVVDGMSNDGTLDILQRWTDAYPQLHVLPNPAKIVPTAMNIGIKAAQGEIIVRLDCHAKYPPDYLHVCVETSRRTNADNVGGVVITLPRDDSRQAQIVQAVTTHRFGVGNSNFRLNAKEGATDTVPYGCFKRAVFERVGWYDERLVRNQDYELNRRIAHMGGTIWSNPAIHCDYYNQATLRGLLKQAVNTAAWNAWMWYLAPYSFAPRHVIPFVFLVGMIGAGLITLLFSWGWLTLLVTLLPYSLLALWASSEQSRRYGWWLFPLLPFLFFAYHVCYGYGILNGVVQLLVNRSPVQHQAEPWVGAKRYRIT